MPPAPRRPGRPARLSRAGVVAEATALVAEEGLDALTMRSLARRLGADPMAVYRHVRDKDDLMGAMCDALLADLDPLGPGGDWEPQLRRWATQLHERLAAAPALVPVLAGAPVTPTALELARAVLALLQGAGFTPELAAGAISAVFSYVIGFAVLEAATPAPPAPSAGTGAGAAAEDPAAALLLEPADFGLGLDLVVEGLARRSRA